MARRPRKYIPLQERYAAALACLLPAWHRDIFRRDRVSAEKVIACFEIDHISLHAWGGEDKWWNLDPKLKAEHREKSRADTSRAAKAVRIEAKWGKFMRAVAKGRKPPPARRNSFASKRRLR